MEIISKEKKEIKNFKGEEFKKANSLNFFCLRMRLVNEIKKIFGFYTKEQKVQKIGAGLRPVPIFFVFAINLSPPELIKKKIKIKWWLAILISLLFGSLIMLLEILIVKIGP